MAASAASTAAPGRGGLTLERGFAGPGIVIAQSDLSLAPVRVNITNAYYGVFVSDILDLTPTVSLTLSGRENVAEIDLSDQNGTTLTGNHSYSHFNPGVGLSWKILPSLSVYASYSQANRAPTPAELSCASITSPCTLTNFFVADPSLKQVVANTVETGLRPTADTSLVWNLGLFGTEITTTSCSRPARSSDETSSRTSASRSARGSRPASHCTMAA